MPSLADLVQQYRTHFLYHDPQRSARMLAPQEAKQRGRKYDDIDSPLSDIQLTNLLLGRETYAVPWEANGLGHILALDIDSGGKAAITALLAACHQRGLWAFGQYTPKTGVPDDQQHGYVYVPFAELTNVERLQLLGDSLIHSLHRPQWKIENRAHGADTRLPLTYHHVNRSWGELLLPDRTIPIDADPLAALTQLFAVYQPNSVTLLPPAPEPTPLTPAAKRPGTTDIASFNATHDIEDLLISYGAKRVGRGLYVCPFHDDRRASLGVYVRHGQTFCRCLSQHSDCPLAQRTLNDSFNVYCIGEGYPGTPLTPEQALRKINNLREKSDPPTGSQTPQNAPGRPQAPPDDTSSPSMKSGRSGTFYVPPTTLDRPIVTVYRDPALTAYLLERGSSGVLILHKAREKLGEQATNRQINVEITRRRGRPYTERHLRALNRERRQLIEQWQAEQTAQQEAETAAADTGDFHPSAMHDMELRLANRGGEHQPAEPITEGASFGAPPPRRRQRQQKTTKERIYERRRKRLERWRAMPIHALEREYAILQRVTAKSTNYRQKQALEGQLQELGFELARCRGHGLQAMLIAQQADNLTPAPAHTAAGPPPLRVPVQWEQAGLPRDFLELLC